MGKPKKERSKKKYCPSCGVEVQPDDTFCSDCKEDAEAEKVDGIDPMEPDALGTGDELPDPDYSTSHDGGGDDEKEHPGLDDDEPGNVFDPSGASDETDDSD